MSGPFVLVIGPPVTGTLKSSATPFVSAGNATRLPSGLIRGNNNTLPPLLGFVGAPPDGGTLKSAVVAPALAQKTMALSSALKRPEEMTFRGPIVS